MRVAGLNRLAAPRADAALSNGLVVSVGSPVQSAAQLGTRHDCIGRHPRLAARVMMADTLARRRSRLGEPTYRGPIADAPGYRVPWPAVRNGCSIIADTRPRRLARRRSRKIHVFDGYCVSRDPRSRTAVGSSHGPSAWAASRSGSRRSWWRPTTGLTPAALGSLRRFRTRRQPVSSSRPSVLWRHGGTTCSGRDGERGPGCSMAVGAGSAAMS